MSSVCIRLDFHEMHARLRGPNNFLTLYKITYFLSLADEIADSRPDMNIKIAPFTVREKSIKSLVKSDIQSIINIALVISASHACFQVHQHFGKSVIHQ